MIDLSAFTAADAANIRTRLSAAYSQLSALNQEIVQLFSVLYEPASRTTFMRLFNRAGGRDENGKAFANKTLKPYLDQLLEAELLVQEQGQRPQCHPLLAEIATRDAVQSGRFEAYAKAVEQELPIRTYGRNAPRHFERDSQFLREVRIGIYRQDFNFIGEQFEDYYRFGKDKLSLEEVLQRVYNNPFDGAWFRTLPKDLYESVLWNILLDATLKLTVADQPFSLLQQTCADPGNGCSDSLRILWAEQLLLRGRVQEAEQSVARLSDGYADSAASLTGWVSFLRGDPQKAIDHFSVALKGLRKAKGKRKIYFNSMGGLFFCLALLKEGSPERLREAEGYATLTEQQQAKHWLKPIYSLLRIVLQIQQGELSEKESVAHAVVAPYQEHHSLETLFRSLCIYWVDAKQAKKRLPKLLESLHAQAKAAGYDWIAMEAAELLSRLKPRGRYAEQATALRKDSAVQTIVDLVQPQEPWELCLNALASLHKEPQAPTKTEARQRLAWFIKYYANGCSVQPREQKLSAKGVWSKGRNVALKRLSENPSDFGYLTPQDLRACAHIQAYSYGYYGQTQYEFDEKAIAALIGHPLVFWEDSPSTRLEIVKAEPELLVKKDKEGWLLLEFSPRLQEKQEILVLKETPTRLKVLEVHAEHRRIADIIGEKNRLEVPAAAKERVLAAINGVSGIVTVHSDIGGGVESAKEVPAEAKPHVHLLPAGEGLKVAVLARPFAQGGPYFRPGMGGETVIAEIEGKRLQTTRNLHEEKSLAAAVTAACPTLTHAQEQDGEWLVEDPEDCLELLLELQALEDSVALEWPEGEKLRIPHRADLEHFHLTIKRQRDWFAVSGELPLADDLVLDMQHLLELIEQTPSRFVPLGEGQFLALTQTFRKRLDELRVFSEKHGKGVRFHPLAALALEDFLEEVGDLQADRHWKGHILRLQKMQILQPELPSTLQAELRDYQIDGFHWLARLSQWGVGACLADDMGLGKTLQALAVILTRAPDGPTLVVAPTSVGMIWMSEARRFAPTLKAMQFGSGDRQRILNKLAPFDLLVCSYGLLQQEEVAEMLAKVQWQSIVLDEAQAIKNMTTKRSQAAMKLQSEFKILTTGTPIENHLGELWNLFRFINPGLLGSLESFNQRFATPIERFQDKQARTKLKKLIQPFLLRRTKNQVLEELPSRTEIVLQVELSREEKALYEALRQQAVSKLTATEAPSGQKHLQVLAEIMKLRRACCNARLVLPESPLPSAKLQVFGEVLEELLDNQHKALVFSQFVDHLHIIRDHLDGRKVPYQYLDGSTPAAQRKKRVDAFQAGEGEVFLISLKAGGTGLNLTAADYVIHMDPWWNPAVEDQASDRAHRIGQQRPVTIYRLVTKDTIEEQIVDLHHHKRDLADSLLEGADMSGKISTDDLLRLISER